MSGACSHPLLRHAPRRGAVAITKARALIETGMLLVPSTLVRREALRCSGGLPALRQTQGVA